MATNRNDDNYVRSETRQDFRRVEFRKSWRPIVLASFAALLVLAGGVYVSVVSDNRDDQDNSRISPNDLPTDVGIDQKPGAQVPLDIRLRDETGTAVQLRDLVQGKPIILNLVYYECPMLCNMTMDGQVRSLTELSLDAGKDFTALTVSFDPRENHDLSAAAKRTALKRYGRLGAERGWRFLTGDEAQTRRLADAVGFRYRFDATTGQYAHAAGLVVLTPDGKVSRYLYGVEFPPRDLRLALVQASGGQVGTATDQVLLLCYHYDPTTGKYGLAIMNLLRLAGLATVLGMGTAIIVMIRRDRGVGFQPATETDRQVGSLFHEPARSDEHC
ncbi:MAG: SCO family protein [Pirellulaceae bacterium]